MRDHGVVTITFDAIIWYWRGPAPWHFVTVPEAICIEIHAIAGAVTYGWGMIPATARIGSTVWKTSLFPKDGRYIVPIKAAVRRAERLAEGDTVTIGLTVG